MENNVIQKAQDTFAATGENVLKVTALVYLREALLNEEFEGCAELIQTASEFGATSQEVAEVINSLNRAITLERVKLSNAKKEQGRF